MIQDVVFAELESQQAERRHYDRLLFRAVEHLLTQRRVALHDGEAWRLLAALRSSYEER